MVGNHSAMTATLAILLLLALSLLVRERRTAARWYGQLICEHQRQLRSTHWKAFFQGRHGGITWARRRANATQDFEREQVGPAGKLWPSGVTTDGAETRTVGTTAEGTRPAPRKPAIAKQRGRRLDRVAAPHAEATPAQIIR